MNTTTRKREILRMHYSFELSIDMYESLCFISEKISKRLFMKNKIQYTDQLLCCHAYNGCFSWTLVLRKKIHDYSLKVLRYDLCRRQEQGKGPIEKKKAP